MSAGGLCAAVWSASVLRGIPVYLVQDIETSYYPDLQNFQNAVLASYRQEFRYLTTSGRKAGEPGCTTIVRTSGACRNSSRSVSPR